MVKKKKKGTLQKVGIEVTYLDIRKAIYGTSFTNIILNSEKLKSFPLRSRTRKGILLSHFFFQNSFGNHSYDNQRDEKKTKGNPNWKGKSKTVIVCRGHDTIHRQSLPEKY